jgi:hypothetical protein
MNDKNTKPNDKVVTESHARDHAPSDSGGGGASSTDVQNRPDSAGGKPTLERNDATIPTLESFYAARRPKAAALVKSLRLGSGAVFPDTERQAVLAEIKRLDPHLAKSLALAQVAMDPTKDRAVFDWIGEVIVSELRSHWQGEAGLSPAETFDEISRVLRAGMERKESRKKNLNLLFMALAWLAPRGLRPQEALRGIEHALVPAKRSSTTSDERERQAVSELARLKVGAKLIQGFLRILDPWRVRTREAEAESAAHREETSRLGSRIAALEQSLTQSKEQTSSVEARLTELSRQLEDRSRRLSAQHNLAQSQLALVNGAINGWLEKEVRPRLTDALDAAECYPPRLEVLRDRLAGLLAMLDQKKRGKWG